MSAAPIPIDDAPVKQLETKALSLPDQARAIKISDAATHREAAEKLLGVAELRREIVAHYGPMKTAAHEAHKRICAAETSMLAPVAEAEKILKLGISIFENEQRRIQAERERIDREEAERKAAEEMEAAIEAAEKEGASVQEIEAIIDQPIVAPAVHVEPTFAPVAGVVTRTIYSAEVVNMRELCRAVADGKASLELVAPNMTALNAMARALKTTFAVPGCRVKADSSVAAGRR